MGVNHSAVLFVGVKANFKNTKKKETRYNEKTGEAYEIEISDGLEIWIGNEMVLSEKDIGNVFYDWMKLDDFSERPDLAHLALFQDGDDVYIGSMVERIRDNRENSFVEPNLKIPVHVQQFADKYKAEVKFVMYLQVG